MKGRRSLQDLVRDAGVHPVPDRQPCLPAPTQPAIIASEEDHVLARQMLVEQRKNNPDYRDPSKQLKRIFRSSKEKEKLQDTNLWDFSQEELDSALLGIVDKPATSPGLVQAFLSLGAKVNFVEILDEKKSKGKQNANAAARRRSTVLQRAATVRRADNVSLLASSGADQTTLDEGLKAALAANDHSSVQELLRHGADLNKAPNALADAVRSNDQNLVRLLLRAPKALRPEIVSTCLPAAVQQKSTAVISLLVAHGADPNFNGASALSMAISQREYRLAVALVAGPIPMTHLALQELLQPAIAMPTAQEVYQFLQLLFCCGLPPFSPALPGLLITASKRNDTQMAQLLIRYGVSAEANEAECLRNAIMHSNWGLTDAILDSPVSAANASLALAVVPADAPKPERLHVISALVSRGANGKPLENWLIRAVEDSDSSLMDLLLNAGTPIESGNNRALQAAVARKDIRSLRTLLRSRPSPASLSQAFICIRSAYSPSERLETVQLLLQNGARGPEVDQALVDAIADTSSSRDIALITELIRHGASVNHANGKAISLAVAQADIAILRLLCGAKPSIQATSTALPLTFDAGGSRRSVTFPMIEVLLANGYEEQSLYQTLQLTIKGGPENLDIVQRLIAADARLIGPAFQQTICLDKVHQKAPILRVLLSKGIPQDALDHALITETKNVVANNDTTVLKLLLEYGSSINYNDGEAFSIGVASSNSALVRLLLSSKAQPSQASVTKAFRALFHDSNIQSRTVSAGSHDEIARELLFRGVHQPAIDSALRAILDTANPTKNITSTVDLLLRNNADVNTADGTCFLFAAQRGDFPLFEKLLGHGPEFSTIIPTLIGSDLDEDLLMRLLGSCFDAGYTYNDSENKSIELFKKPTVILALHHHPRCGELIKLLLAHGYNANITAYELIDPSTGEELVPALVWALAQPQKMISSSVIVELLNGGASPTRASPVSEVAPIALAAREGRSDIVQALLERGADASVRDKWNRSALFFASSTSVASVVRTLSAHALKDDGSLHEAARCLQLEVSTILVEHGHKPNFPSRLHGGRNALGEFCLTASVTNGSQRTRVRQLIRLFLDHGANPTFKARNERSAVTLALDNPHSSLEITEALLETEVWEDINDEKHMFRDLNGLWYSPLKYVELVPSSSRAQHKQDLIDLLRDKGCEPKYYSETAEQPAGAIGMPAPIKRIADRQQEHLLTLRHAKEASEHTRMLEEATHRDYLRRKQEQEDAERAAASASAAHYQTLEQQKHDFEVQRVRSAERMKRGEKAAWHSLLMEQERDNAAQRQQIEDRKASAAYVNENRLIEARKAELEHKSGVERRALKEKEELYDRNVKRQLQITQRVDESAQLHARLRQDRPAIEGAPQWGTVD